MVKDGSKITFNISSFHLTLLLWRLLWWTAFIILRLIGQNEERIRTEKDFSININDTIISHLPFGIQIADSILLLDFGDYVITVLAWPESGKILSHCPRVLDQIVHISIQFSFKNKNADTVMKVRSFKTGPNNPYVTLGQTIRMLHWRTKFSY